MKCESAVAVSVLQLLVGQVLNVVVFHRCQIYDVKRLSKNYAKMLNRPPDTGYQAADCHNRLLELTCSTSIGN